MSPLYHTPGRGGQQHGHCDDSPIESEEDCDSEHSKGAGQRHGRSSPTCRQPQRNSQRRLCLRLVVATAARLLLLFTAGQLTGTVRAGLAPDSSSTNTKLNFIRALGTKFLDGDKNFFFQGGLGEGSLGLPGLSWAWQVARQGTAWWWGFGSAGVWSGPGQRTAMAMWVGLLDRCAAHTRAGRRGCSPTHIAATLPHCHHKAPASGLSPPPPPMLPAAAPGSCITPGTNQYWLGPPSQGVLTEVEIEGVIHDHAKAGLRVIRCAPGTRCRLVLGPASMATDHATRPAQVGA